MQEGRKEKVLFLNLEGMKSQYVTQRMDFELGIIE